MAQTVAPQDKGPPAKKPAQQPAGPHAKPELTNEEATPGAGALPSTKDKDASVDTGTG